MQYRADVDGLRAIAVLLVVVFHFALLPLGEAGFVGVDVFFVISGFLVTAILRQQIEGGGFALGAFYAGRVRRLAPALCAVLLATLVFGYFALLPFEFEELARQVAAAQGYVANVYFWRNIDYFRLGAENVYLLHTWSLAVEEQFYLLYPLGLLLIYRQRRCHPAVVIALLAAASFALNLWQVERRPEATFYLLPMRAWELLTGALLTWLPAGCLASRWARDALGALGAAALVGAVLVYDRSIAVPGAFALMPVAGATCLLAAGAHAHSLTRRALSLPLLVYLGRISYALYLVHWPINTFALRAWADDYSLAWRWAAFAGSILTAMALYHWVENPIRYGRKLVARKHLLASYVVAVVVTFVLCLGVILSAGMPARLPPLVAQLAASSEDRSPPLEACAYRDASAPLRPCSIGDATRPLRWLVVGDSHAWAAHDAFAMWLTRRGEQGAFAYRQGCPPLRDVQLVGDRSGMCPAFNAAVSEYLERNPGVQGVFLVSSWLQIHEGLLADAPGQAPDRDRALRVFERSFADTLTWLHEREKTVYLWGPVPPASAHVPRELAAAAWRGESEPALGLTAGEYRDLFAYYFSALEQQRERVTVSVDPGAFLCASGRCRISADGQPVFFDNSHVTRSSASRWADLIEYAEHKAGRSVLVTPP